MSAELMPQESNNRELPAFWSDQLDRVSEVGKRVVSIFSRNSLSKESEARLRADREEIIDLGETMLREKPKEKPPTLPTYAGNPGLDNEHDHIIPGQE